MATVASKMTALANEVREISGATNKLSIDAMTTHLDTVNAEITEQESLIADMNEMLDHLGAESVGGGVNIETCTVTVSMFGSAGYLIGVNESGVFNVHSEQQSNSGVYVSSVDVHKDSILVIYGISCTHVYTSDNITLINEIPFPAVVLYVCGDGSVETN